MFKSGSTEILLALMPHKGKLSYFSYHLDEFGLLQVTFVLHPSYFWYPHVNSVIRIWRLLGERAGEGKQVELFKKYMLNIFLHLLCLMEKDDLKL